MISDSKKKGLQKKDYEILAEFRYTLRRFLHFSEKVALLHHLTPQHYQTLLAIEGFPGRNWLTIGELANHLQIAPHSAVGLVDRLVKSRLVCRKPHPDDKRKVRVLLTSRGLAILEKLNLVHRKELKSIGPELSVLLRRIKEELSDDLRNSAGNSHTLYS
ncbi:MAG: MarR family transcriptional regulator [Chthoniobacterales bacterium]